MFPGLEPLCPFKKSCHLGHLCSLRHTTAHRYCQILFDSRSLRETGLSLPPKVNRPLWILQLFVETQVFLPLFFFFFSFGGLSPPGPIPPKPRLEGLSDAGRGVL